MSTLYEYEKIDYMKQAQVNKYNKVRVSNVPIIEMQCITVMSSAQIFSTSLNDKKLCPAEVSGHGRRLAPNISGSI